MAIDRRNRIWELESELVFMVAAASAAATGAGAGAAAPEIPLFGGKTAISLWSGPADFYSMAKGFSDRRGTKQNNRPATGINF